MEVDVRKKINVVAIGVSAWLIAACGGSESPGAASAQADQASAGATVSAVDSKYRVALAQGGERGALDKRLRGARGPVEVWVSLEQNSVAAERVALAEAAGLGAADDAAAKRSPQLKQGAAAHLKRVQEAQGALMQKMSSLGGKELARVQTAHNAVAVRIDASQLAQLAAMPGVAKVRPVLHYQLALSETVPYVGGAAVQSSGRDGSGVTVAVLDSGIDYTHRNLGGEGTAAAYAAAWGTAPADPKNTTLDGLFPTAKVVGGYDFVGETWGRTNGVEFGTVTEDPDPIDLEGHGTHVADIIAGKSLDGAHKGMAPGAKLVAVKVCSAVSGACNGVALLKGMDYALDPNGDGDTSDAVDVINMSLGSDYGQVEDDLTLAATNAVKLGVVVVVSAGNGGNKPYIAGSPSTSPGVISVAQTQVPSAKAIPLLVNAPAAIAGVYGNTQLLDFAPVGGGVTGDVLLVGRGCPADSVGPGIAEDAYLGSPSGKIALIDRGGCSVSLKVDRAAKAGATAVLIGLVAPGDAVNFSNGGGTTFVPGLVIQQSLSNAIKAQLTGGQTVSVSISPAAAIALVGSMASTSSRGPSISFQTIKPEIGAPGASLSAEAGTGTGQTTFGGTSGAAPMVAGAAALLVQAYPNRSPEKIKAMLMNSAETTVYTNPALLPGELAPITRIGGGELRVDRAIAMNTIATNHKTKSASLSFGALEVSARTVVEQTLRVQNLSHGEKLFTVTPSFRYANDEASGAVRVVTRSVLRVSGHGSEELEVKLIIDPTKLPAWTLNGGTQGGNGAALNGPEYDGYITLTSGSEKITVPWHVLPRKAAEIQAELTERGKPGPTVKLRNRGLNEGEYDVFSLAGVSKRIPRSELPGPGDNFAVIDMRSVGVRGLTAAQTGLPFDVVEFAINTKGRRAHPNYPAEFDVEIDTTGDGVADFVVFNAENGGFGLTGQNAVRVGNLATGVTTTFFFTDADLNSGNVIFTVPLNIAGGVTLAPGATMGFSVFAIDNYFSGNLTDSIEGMRFTPGQPRFGVVGEPFGAVPAKTASNLGVTTATLPDTLSSELGLLMMYRRNDGKEADVLRIR
jgi:minor extracellular serine protease Vpr